MSSLRSGLTRRGMVAATALATIAGLTACSGGGATTTGSVSVADQYGSAKNPITLTMWSWGGGDVKTIEDEYHKLHPHVTVKITEFGSSTELYPKLQIALKAGKGGPDLSSMELMNMPSFAAQGYLLDLAKYGAKLGDYTGSAASAASFNGGLYAIPTDTGPLVMYYDKKVFDQYGIAVPTTWDQYRDAAAKLKAKGHYIASTDPGDASLLMGLLQQAGAKPFSLTDKSKLTVQFADAGTKQVTDYWGGMLKDGYVKATPAWSQDWFNKLANGTYATWLTGAWGGSVLSGSIPKAAGDWRVALLPNWSAGTASDGVWGGSSTVVTKQSTHAAAATAFAEWYSTDQYIAQIKNAANIPMPASEKVLSDPRYTAAASTFLGGQKPGQLYIQASDSVAKDWQYLPFQLYANTIFKDTVGQNIAGDGDIAAGLTSWQAKIAAYGTQNGFTVATK